MNNFKKKNINSEILAIADIWSYKIKIAIIKILKDKIELLSFSEKRQSIWDIENNQIQNLDSVCENISLAIKKAEEKAQVKTDSLIINSTFSQSFLESKKINYKRKNNKQIDKEELKIILEEVEKKVIKSNIKNIEANFLQSKNNLELIINHISNIYIDWKNTDNILWENWEKISFFITNIFLQKNSLENINYIEKYLNKKIIKIIPEEFSLTRLWEKQKDVVIIDIWNSSSYIIIKNEKWDIIWARKVNIWIEKLVNKIKKNSSLTRSEIIKKIDRDDFAKQEKKEFLEIFSFILIEAIKSIIKDKVCTNNFFILWWWWNNSFFKNYFKKINFTKFDLKISGNIKFILPDVKKIAKIENVEEILNKSNLNLISLILSYKFLLDKKQNLIENLASKIIKNLKD